MTGEHSAEKVASPAFGVAHQHVQLDVRRIASRRAALAAHRGVDAVDVLGDRDGIGGDQCERRVVFCRLPAPTSSPCLSVSATPERRRFVPGPPRRSDAWQLAQFASYSPLPRTSTSCGATARELREPAPAGRRGPPAAGAAPPRPPATSARGRSGRRGGVWPAGAGAWPGAGAGAPCAKTRPVIATPANTTARKRDCAAIH